MLINRATSKGIWAGAVCGSDVEVGVGVSVGLGVGVRAAACVDVGADC